MHAREFFEELSEKNLHRLGAGQSAGPRRSDIDYLAGQVAAICCRNMSFKIVFNGKEKRSLVSFANGLPSKEACFPSMLLTHNSNNNKRLMVVDGTVMKYVGENQTEQNSNKFLAAEISQTTGMAEIFSTDKFVLRPVLKLDQHSDKEVETKTAVKRNKTFWQQQDDLNTDFGSHRKRKALNSRLKNNTGTLQLSLLIPLQKLWNLIIIQVKGMFL